MKKRAKLILGLSLVLVLVIGGATMAWFTSNPEQVTNTFTAGSVAVTLNDYKGDSIATPFTPIANVNPGDWYDKNVSVTSNGSKAAYVRVKLTSAWSGGLSTGNIILDLGNDWVLSDGYYYYKKILNKDDTTTLLLSGVAFDGKLTTINYQNASFTIDVKAEAVQASHYAFRDVWGLIRDVPAEGVEAWTPANEAPTAAQ